MASLRHVTALLLACAIGASCPVAAQTTAPPGQQASSSEDPAARRQWALQRIRGLSEHIAAGRDTESRVRALATLGNLVCREDAALARSIFDKAVEIARPLQKASYQPAPNRNANPNPRPIRNYTWLDLMRQIGKCDPEYGAALREKDLEETKDQFDHVQATPLFTAREQALENPERAAALASRALESGPLSSEEVGNLIFVLHMVHNWDMRQADALFLRGLERLNQNLNTDAASLLQLGNYLFSASQQTDSGMVRRSVRLAGSAGAGVISIMGTQSGTSPELARIYLETSLTILARLPVSPEGDRVNYAAAYQMGYKAAEFAPHLVPLFENQERRFAANVTESDQRTLRSSLDFMTRNPLDYSEAFQQERNPARRERLRLGALQGTLRRNDFSAARSIAAETEDEQARAALTALTAFFEAAHALARGDLNRPHEELSKLNNPLLRLLLRTGYGVELARQGQLDAAHAELLWAQRETMLVDAAHRPYALLAVAGALARVESSTALLAFQQAVGALNDLGDEDAAEVQVVQGPLLARNQASPFTAHVLRNAAGFYQRVSYAGGQATFIYSIKGVNDFVFTAALMRKLAPQAEGVEAAVLSLTGERRRAEALATVAAAYLEGIPKAEAAHTTAK